METIDFKAMSDELLKSYFHAIDDLARALCELARMGGVATRIRQEAQIYCDLRDAASKELSKRKKGPQGK